MKFLVLSVFLLSLTQPIYGLTVDTTKDKLNIHSDFEQVETPTDGQEKMMYAMGDVGVVLLKEMINTPMVQSHTY